MNKASLKKFLEHPDKDSIISKLIEGTSPKTIHDGLKEKYISESEKKFVLSEDLLADFKEKHLDFYIIFRNDVLAVKSPSIDKSLELSLKRNKKYRERIMELADQEVDVKQLVKNLIVNIEARVEQVFDKIQEDPDDFKDDNTLIKWVNSLMDALDRCNKIVNEAPDQVVQHQHTIQIADQQIAIIIETIKDILSKIDYETSLYFMEQYNKRIGELKAPEEFRPASTEIRLAEAKLLNEQIAKKEDGIEGLDPLK